MFTNYMLDAVSDIAHLMIARYIIIVIIIPILGLVVYIYNTIKTQHRQNNLGINIHSTQDNLYKDINLLRSAKDKLEEGYGLESLSREELRILDKYDIL